MSSPAAKTLRNGWREARFVVCLWVLAFSWTIGYCYLRGYQHSPQDRVVTNGLAVSRTPESLRMIFGVPDWIAFGILAPWLACSVITIGYGLFGMADDDLGVEAEDAAHGV